MRAVTIGPFFLRWARGLYLQGRWQISDSFSMAFKIKFISYTAETQTSFRLVFRVTLSSELGFQPIYCLSPTTLNAVKIDEKVILGLGLVKSR